MSREQSKPVRESLVRGIDIIHSGISQVHPSDQNVNITVYNTET